jgi:3-phosphoshikimate 1-carboxyvinyltransferase
MSYLDLAPIKSVSGCVLLPGSKSISNRTLLLAALADGTTTARGLLRSDDTDVMLNALRTLGIRIERIAENDYQISGASGRFPVDRAELFLGNAGTAFRPLTAVLALCGGHYRLAGVPRMHERPIGDLVEALNAAGARIRYLDHPGFPPLEIEPGDFPGDAVFNVRGEVSSQFLTALLMALPLATRDHGNPALIRVTSELVSKPYIEITLNLMARFGVHAEREGWIEFRIPARQSYRSPGIIDVEGDASSASYFLAAGIIGGGPVRVEGVGRNSIQGDVRFADVLEQMGGEITYGDNWIEARGKPGKLRALDIDLNHIPDAAMTLAVAALFADGTTTIRNIASWRVKETDRIAAMATELRKLGAEVEEGSDFIRITPPRSSIPSGPSAASVGRSAGSDGELRHLPNSLPCPRSAIDTYDDHRMAMCFSLAALGGVPVRINDPACVNKTFPGYFDELRRISK